MQGTTHTKLSDGGRIVIPLEIRQAFGLQPGDELILAHDKEGIHILTRDLAVARAQEAVRRLNPKQPGTKTLEKMRRAEARKNA